MAFGVSLVLLFILDLGGIRTVEPAWLAAVVGVGILLLGSGMLQTGRGIAKLRRAADPEQLVIAAFAEHATPVLSTPSRDLRLLAMGVIDWPYAVDRVSSQISDTRCSRPGTWATGCRMGIARRTHRARANHRRRRDLPSGDRLLVIGPNLRCRCAAGLSTGTERSASRMQHIVQHARGRRGGARRTAGLGCQTPRDETTN